LTGNAVMQRQAKANQHTFGLLIILAPQENGNSAYSCGRARRLQ
jgi:hypothetical protein